MTIPSLFILVALGFLGLWILLWLGGLPGKTAAQRNHPQADAINILGWVGLVFGGVGWVVALTWAYIKPVFPLAETAQAGPTVDNPAEEAR